MKDLFSDQSSQYKTFRPGYPQSLIDYILSSVPQKNLAWDCATGNGQAAMMLAPYFKKIVATDISEAQLSQAEPHANIEYYRLPAENTGLAADSFDLITVAQAYHWLDWTSFETEVRRVARNGAVLAIWMYNRFVTPDDALNRLMDHFYVSVTGPYWDNRRKYVDENYSTVPFPYNPLPVRSFSFETVWTMQQLVGYLSSWSAVQEYKRVQGQSPLSLIEKELEQLLPHNKTIPIRFPIHMKMGRIVK